MAQRRFHGESRFQNIRIDNPGAFGGEHDSGKFSARFDLFLIREAWERGCDFEDLADGFGPGLGTMGGDWSGIRDSGDDATRQMFERALNFHFGQ